MNSDGQNDLIAGFADYFQTYINIVFNDFESESEVVLFPSVLDVTRGNWVSGGIPEVIASDNSDLVVQRGVTSLSATTEIELTSVTSLNNPQSISLTVEAAVFASSEVRQTVEAFDFESNLWVEVSESAASRFSDSTVTVDINSNPGRFVDQATGQLKTRVRFHSPSRRLKFSSSIDLFQWTIQP